MTYREELKWLASRQAEALVPFLNPLPMELKAGAISETPSTWLTQLGDTLGDPQRLHPIQLMCLPKLFFYMNGWSWLWLSKICSSMQQLASVSSQPLYLLKSGLKSGTSSSQPRFTAWLHLGISKPGTSSSHLRVL